MTTEEFSNNIDILLNSYNQRLGNSDIRDIKLDEYEKSLYLTEAQNDIVKSLYTGKNPFFDSFELNEEVSRSLESLVKTSTLSSTPDSDKITLKSYIFSLPSDVWYIIYEKAVLSTPDKEVEVLPVRHNSIEKQLGNPFRGPSENRVLRINKGGNKVELISNYAIKNYIIRYLSQPSPIITENLPNNLTIDGISVKTECTLNSSLHEKILESAVSMAIQRKAVSLLSKEK